MLSNRRTLTIEWGHCDPAGIVFYPRYFEYFDASTAALFAAAGLDKFAMRERYQVVGYPMVDTRARFLIPSRYGEEISIETEVMRVGKSSFDIEHRLFRADATLAVECQETRVWLGQHPDKPRPRPIPRDVVALMTGTHLNATRTPDSEGVTR